MKKIILIGDSIRMGYDKYVKEAFEGSAEVYYHNENTRFSAYALRFLHDWINKSSFPADADLIHWNVGLWDVVRVYGEEPLTSIEEYKRNLAALYRRFKLHFPGAVQIFATSTSSVEEKYGANFKRYNKDIEEYNKAAIEVLAPLGVKINDLYPYTLTLGEDCRGGDPTHYNTPAGVKAMGDRVVSVISAELGIKAEEINIENFKPHDYTAENIGR